MKRKEFALPLLAFAVLFVFFGAGLVAASDQQMPSAAQETVTKAAQTMAPETENAVSTAVGKININKADVETLAGIKGIGRETAENIILRRKQIGAFENIDQLLQVKGIGEKTLEQIRPFISLD